jgi:replication-associated recombination protein RarA
MTDLFSGQEAPLADRMRPRTLAEFIGQRHLLGEGRLLRRAIEADRLTSSIFFGPPGCGKTTLASIIANSTKSAFVQLNAVTSGVADVRKVIADAQERRAYGQSTYLLLDECHRWSKAQSDSILPAIERGIIRFIGSTTENPMVSMTPAIVSRCRELKLHPWDDRTVLSVLEKHGVTGQRAQEALHVSGGSIGKALAVAGDEQYWQRRSEVMRDFFALERRSDILRISSTWKDRKDDAEELLDDVEDMLRTLLLCHLGQRSESAVTPYPAAWQRFSREGELSAMMRLLDAVAQARQMRANQVTWQAVVERLLLSLMEEKSKWST